MAVVGFNGVLIHLITYSLLVVDDFGDIINAYHKELLSFSIYFECHFGYIKFVIHYFVLVLGMLKILLLVFISIQYVLGRM